MPEKYKELLPLEFQKIKEVEKTKEINKIKIFTSIDFYQSSRIKPDNFHKPISKIISFEFK
jgi:hypothetical protein